MLERYTLTTSRCQKITNQTTRSVVHKHIRGRQGHQHRDIQSLTSVMVSHIRSNRRLKYHKTPSHSFSHHHGIKTDTDFVSFPIGNFFSTFSPNHNFGNILVLHLQLIAKLLHHLEIGTLSHYLKTLLLMEETQTTTGCIKPCKSWDKLPTSTDAGF